jgi:hypothetical protein
MKQKETLDPDPRKSKHLQPCKEVEVRYVRLQILKPLIAFTTHIALQPANIFWITSDKIEKPAAYTKRWLSEKNFGYYADESVSIIECYPCSRGADFCASILARVTASSCSLGILTTIK